MERSAGVPRLVATDLDGTLLRSDGTVSPRTARVLAALDRAGVPVVFVTGRPRRWMDAVRPHVGAHGLAVCSNGALVTALRTGAVVMERPVPREAALAATQAVRAALPGARFALERVAGFAMEPGFPVRGAVPAAASIAPLEHLLAAAEPVKILVRDDGAQPEALLDAVLEAVAGGVVATRSVAEPMVEISAAGVTKATTLALLCGRFGVRPDEVVAFGDMPNDLPMLEWAGRSFAVAGAHPALDAVVTDRTARCDDDGVAIALERVFGLG